MEGAVTPALTLVIERPLRRNPGYWEATSGRRAAVVVIAILSLLLWSAIVFAGRWIDGNLEQPCAFALAEDGAERCLPFDSPAELTARAVALFSDDACTLPIQVGIRDPSCAAGEARFVLEALGGGLTRVYEAGPAVLGPLYQFDATCVESSPGSSFYELGAELVPQTFVGGTEMVE